MGVATRPSLVLVQLTLYIFSQQQILVSEIYIKLYFSRQNGNKMVAPLVELTSELLARASSTSEVLTLNLTNLLILIVLKALIFGFGLFSVGSSARSAEETSLSQADLSGGMCFIMYTSGAEEKLSCIQRTACEDPKTASEYSTAAKMVYKLHKMLGMDFNPKYETVLNALEDAKSHSLRGGDCAVYQW